jgi:hypothetical protein
MAAADDQHVELFHVKHLSLAKAKARENLAKNILYTDPSYQRIERPHSHVHLFGCDIGRYRTRVKRLYGGIERRAPCTQRRLVARTNGDPATLCTIGQHLANPCDQAIHAEARQARHALRALGQQIGLGPDGDIISLAQVVEIGTAIVEKHAQIGL